MLHGRCDGRCGTGKTSKGSDRGGGVFVLMREYAQNGECRKRARAVLCIFLYFCIKDCVRKLGICEKEAYRGVKERKGRREGVCTKCGNFREKY